MWRFPGSYANRGSETEQASSDAAEMERFACMFRRKVRTGKRSLVLCET